jgi:DNA-binding IclR family transcriptional regulator
MGIESGSDGTVGKALDVLDAVAAYGRPVRFSDLLAHSTYPRATLYRFLQTLTNQGMLAYNDETGTYALGIRLVRLAHTAWSTSSLAPIARPFLDRLSAETGETIHLAQMDHGQVLYVDKRNAAKPVEMFSSAGKVGPAYCTGVGKAILAFMENTAKDRIIAQQSFHRFTAQTLDSAEKLRAELDAIRQRGYAFDREEHEPGIICCAVPIISEFGRVIGAISVTSTTLRTSLTALEQQAPRIQSIAKDIANAAESWRFPEQK